MLLSALLKSCTRPSRMQRKSRDSADLYCVERMQFIGASRENSDKQLLLYSKY